MHRELAEKEANTVVKGIWYHNSDSEGVGGCGACQPFICP